MDKPCPNPTALTPVVHAAICAAVERGLPRKYAASAAHVGRSSMDEWLVDGRKHPGSPQAALLAGIELAEAALVERCMEEILNAHTPGKDGVKDWKARAWVLERRLHEDFSQHQQQHIKLTQEEGVPNFTITPRRHTVPTVEVNGRNGHSGEQT